MTAALTMGVFVMTRTGSRVSVPGGALVEGAGVFVITRTEIVAVGGGVVAVAVGGPGVFVVGVGVAVGASGVPVSAAATLCVESAGPARPATTSITPAQMAAGAQRDISLPRGLAPIRART